MAAHTERYYKLRRLEVLLGNLTHVVKEMAFNEDLPVFDTELENNLKTSYYELMNEISETKNDLKL